MVTIDKQVGAQGDSILWSGAIFSNNSGLALGVGMIESGVVLNNAIRFTGVTIPVGATITSAYLSFYYVAYSGTPPACTLSAEDAANPGAITSASDGNGRTKTTANISVTGPIAGTWWNTNDIKTIIQELVNSYSYASGSAMQFIIAGAGSGVNYSIAYDYYYGSSSSYQPKLHIEYTSGSAIPVIMSQYRRRVA